jgi:hypothetical protein
MTTIPAYIVNLKRRTDRKENILKEFAGRKEFTLHMVEAIERERGAMGLWNTITHILADLVDDTAEFVLLCEDDHQFTPHYTKEVLFDCIAEAKEREADILSGGVSWFEDCFPVSEKLFSIQKFSGLQFTIIFKKMFARILHAGFGAKDVADYKIAELAESKFVIHPYISIQRDYGYSDATPANKQEGKVEGFFEKSDEHFRRLREVNLFYKDFGGSLAGETMNEETADEYSSILLPVYIISAAERMENRQHIQEQFSGRSEFDTRIVPIAGHEMTIADHELTASANKTAAGHEIEAVALWQTIRNIIRMAIDSDDDVIIICRDDHEFTADYSVAYLVRNIIGAHEQGADILLGGLENFGHAVPITEDRFWVNPFWSSRFFVLYKKIFPLILKEPFDEKISVDEILSAMTSNKMLLFPFVSVWKDFGSADRLGSAGRFGSPEPGVVGRLGAAGPGVANNMIGPANLFTPSDKRLRSIRQAFTACTPSAHLSR